MSNSYNNLGSLPSNGPSTAELDHMALKVALERNGASNQDMSGQRPVSGVKSSDPRPNQITASLSEEQRVRRLRTESYVQSLGSASSGSASSRSQNQSAPDLSFYQSSSRLSDLAQSRSERGKLQRTRALAPFVSPLSSHSDFETSGDEYEPVKKSVPKARVSVSRSRLSESSENTGQNITSPIPQARVQLSEHNGRQNFGTRVMNTMSSSFHGDFPDAEVEAPMPPRSAGSSAFPRAQVPRQYDLGEPELFVNDNNSVNNHDVDVIAIDDDNDSASEHNIADSNTGDNNSSGEDANGDANINRAKLASIAEQRKRPSQSSYFEPSLSTSPGNLHKRSRISHRFEYQMPPLIEEDQDDISSITSQPLDTRQESDLPRIYIVPVDETPRISYRSIDDVDQETLQETADWIESDSERESELGSTIDMIDDSDDAKTEAKKLLNPANDKPYELSADDSDGNSSSAGSSDEEFVASTTDDIEELAPGETLSVAEARKMRGRRHRVPALNYWLGERIEYAPEPKLGLLTAADVRRVVPAVKKYRPRRRRHTHPRSTVVSEYNVDHESAAVPPRPDVQIPVFDARDRQWHTETVAKSVVSDGFTPLVDEKGNLVPEVYRSNLFGHKSGGKSPLEVYMLKINTGGLFSRYLESRKSSVYLCWSGKCEIRLNDESFELPKGNAFYAPPANDLHIENVDDGSGFATSVKLYVIEFNGPMSEELVNAMLRGATSMVADSSSHREFAESPKSDKTHRNRAPDPTLKIADDNVLDINQEYQPEEVDGPNFDSEAALPDIDIPVGQSAGPVNHVDSDNALNSRASVDTFIKGFSRAVGNPELSQFSRRESRRESQYVPTEYANSDDEMDDFSAALQLGPTTTQEYKNTEAVTSSIRDPIRRVQATARSNTGASRSASLQRTASSRLNTENSVDGTNTSSYLIPNDDENLLPQITRDFLLRRYRQAQQNAEEGEY